MAVQKLPEIWLRGPVEAIPLLLQPVAHALLQAKEEVNALMKAFPDDLLWVKPAGAASAGFHLQHLKGVLDRLFTYAKGKQLEEEQLAVLKAEGIPAAMTTMELVHAFNTQVNEALAELQKTDEQNLLQPRSVGRAGLPSNVLGLLFHAAEHTMRHLGQLIVTVRVVNTKPQP